MKFDVLSRSLDVFQTRFLEASAGTGKTFAIEHLYVRLLIEGETPLNIHEILAVTFTKAATRELKMRIRANIEGALKDLEQGHSALDYLNAQLETEPKQAIYRLRAALASLDHMQIFTIHGFCHKMLIEHAFEAAQSMELNDPDGGEHKKSMQHLIADFFRTGLNPDAYSPVQLFKMLKAQGHNLPKFFKTLLNLVEKGALISPLPCFTTLLIAFQNQLEGLPPIEKERFLEDCAGLITNYKNMTNPSFSSQAALLGALLEKKNCTKEEFDLLLQEEPLFLELMHSDNLKVRIKPIQCHYPHLIEQLQKNLLPLLKQARDPALNLLRIVSTCQDLWAEKKLKTFPDELLKKMAACLENPLFLAKVAQKYHAAIIDEFQDTDPLQWQIFQALFLKNARAFYLVGDPKQSIYAFRNADVNTYLHAKKQVDPISCAFLDTNFRAVPSLVEALNHLFLFSPRWLGNLEVLHISAGKEEEEFPFEDGKGRVHFCIGEGNSGRARSWPTKQMEETLFLPFIAQEIQKLQKWGSCAILVKGRHQAAHVHAFLKKWGIVSVVKRAESLLESPAFTALYDLLHAVTTPRNLTAIRRVLAGPLFGWTAEEVEASTLHDAAPFYQWHRLYQEKGFGAMIGSFLAACPLAPSWAGPFRQWIELILNAKEDPLTFLEEARCKIPEDEEEDFKIRQEETGNKIQIMTTHVSKGLEFDFVFALGVASRHTNRDAYLKVDNHLVRLDAEDPACQAVLQDLETEKLRQFYVALTRAKKRVYVMLAKDPERPHGNAPVELFCKHLGEDLYAALDTLKNQCSLTYSLLNHQIFTLEKQEEEPPAEFPLPVSSPLSFHPCYIQSFSSLAKKQASTSVALQEGDLPPGAETGHLLHKILERALFSPDHLLPIIEQLVATTPLAGWEAKIFALLAPLFDLPLETQNTTFTLRSIPEKNLFQEMEFLFPQDGNLIKGFIDLVIIKDNSFYFIDWKSNLLPDYTPASLERAMQEANYFLQADLYKGALQRYFGHFSLTFGGAFYIFLRGPAIYTMRTESGRRAR